MLKRMQPQALQIQIITKQITNQAIIKQITKQTIIKKTTTKVIANQIAKIKQTKIKDQVPNNISGGIFYVLLKRKL